MAIIQPWPHLAEVWNGVADLAQGYHVNFWTWYEGTTTDSRLIDHERLFEKAQGLDWAVGYLRGAADALGTSVRELLEGAGLDLRDHSEQTKGTPDEM